MFTECHLWVRHCSITGDTAENNTQKPQVQSLIWAFPTLFFLPRVFSPDNLLVSFSYLIFLQRIYYLLAYLFLSFFFLCFSVFFVSSCLSFRSYFVSFSLLFLFLPSFCLSSFFFLFLSPSFLPSLSLFSFLSLSPSFPSLLSFCQSSCLYIPFPQT